MAACRAEFSRLVFERVGHLQTPRFLFGGGGWRVGMRWRSGFEGGARVVRRPAPRLGGRGPAFRPYQAGAARVVSQTARVLVAFLQHDARKRILGPNFVIFQFEARPRACMFRCVNDGEFPHESKKRVAVRLPL
jgi:hypothetical protein